MSELIIGSLTYGAIIVCVGVGIGWLISIGRVCVEKALDQVVEENKKVFIINKLTFLGVIHHELAHALVFMITGAKIVRMQLFTLNSRSGHLGQVQVIHRGPFFIKSIQKTLGAVAPVFLGMLSIRGLMYIIKNYELFGWLETFLWYLALSIFIHMDLSDEDIKVALKGLPITYFILVYGIFIFKVLTEYVFV